MNEQTMQQTIRKAMVTYKRQQQGEHKASEKAGNESKAAQALLEVMRAKQVLEMIDKVDA